MDNLRCHICNQVKPPSEMYKQKMKVLPNGKLQPNNGDWLCYDCGRNYISKRKDQELELIWTELPETTKAYLAGMIDADGHIGLYCKKNGYSYDPRVTITNTSPIIHEWLSDNIGFNLVYQDKYKYSRKDDRDNGRDPSNWKDRYISVFTNRRARGILHAILPYLVIKRKQAELLLLYFSLVLPSGCHIPESIKEKRLEIYEQMKALNQKSKKAI